MNPARIWTFGAVVAVIAILGGAVGLGIQPTLASASAADSSTKQVEAQNDATQIELARLSRLAAKQSTLDTQNADLIKAIPQTLGLNTFSRLMRNIAALDGVKITALSPNAGVAYAAPSSGATVATTASSSSPTPAPTPTVAPVVPGQFGKTDPLISGSNFVVVPVTIIVSGDEAAGLAFVHDAQQQERLFAVDTVTFTASTGADTVSSTTINGNIYSLKR